MVQRLAFLYRMVIADFADFVFFILPMNEPGQRDALTGAVVHDHAYFFVYFFFHEVPPSTIKVMCGRYTLHKKVDELAKRFNLASVSKDISENYNVAPGQVMPVITESDDGKRHLELMKWGLIPIWAKDPSIGYKLINARDDTIFEKPMWRSVILKKRALIPADGFYEWRKPLTPKERKQPFYIHPKQTDLFSFAGVWETWKDNEGQEIMTYSIITTEPNKEMASVHNRMPVILHQEDESSWLEPSKVTRDSIEPLLRPYEDDGLEMIEVSEDVNSPRNNDEHLIYALSE
jgi:putative SOS response-associated peptidase YedK